MTKLTASDEVRVDQILGAICGSISNSFSNLVVRGDAEVLERHGPAEGEVGAERVRSQGIAKLQSYSLILIYAMFY